MAREVPTAQQFGKKKRNKIIISKVQINGLFFKLKDKKFTKDMQNIAIKSYFSVHWYCPDISSKHTQSNWHPSDQVCPFW